MMDQRNELWVFGYGSLMWSPGFDYDDVRACTLDGFHRSLCILSYLYRGTPEKPGLVFGLEAGGQCKGRVFKVPPSDHEKTLAYLYEREMPNKVYLPQYQTVTTDQGEAIEALCFIADHDHHQFVGGLDVGEKTRLVLQGHGKGGDCLEYLVNTNDHLRELGIEDADLQEVIKAAQEPIG